MARRRRTFSSCYCFSASLSSVVVCFQERTSCTFSNFAQSGRRRFTESSFGVSLFASDAEPSKTRSLPPIAFVRSSFEPSDLASNKESLELVAGVPRASQIWISDLTSAILMSLAVRDPSMLSRRAVSSPSCFSGAHRSAPHHLPSPVASTVLLSGRLSLHPLSAEQTLELQVLGQFWILQIMGRVLVMGLLGLMDQKHVLISPQPNMPSFLRRCRSSQKPSPSSFISLAPHLLAPQEVSSAFSLNCLSGSKSISFNLRVKSQKTMESANSSLLHWRLFAEHLLHLGVLELPLPRYQNSSCRGQERSFPSSSSLKERTLSHVSSSALVWSLYRCLRVARSTLVCEGCGSETSVSVISKGSSIWCVIAFDSVAEFWIVFSALGAESISNNRSFLMLVVSHGTSLLYASNVVKVRRRRDDIYCLRIEFAFIYHLIYCFYVFCLGFVAAVLLNLVNLLSVTILSFDGE